MSIDVHYTQDSYYSTKLHSSLNAHFHGFQSVAVSLYYGPCHCRIQLFGTFSTFYNFFL